MMKYSKGDIGISNQTTFGLVTVGDEYLVMGMILGENRLNYLIDSGGVISTCPYELFSVVDQKISSNWFYKTYNLESELYPYGQAIWGYYELVFDDSHYDKLVDFDEEAHRLYYRRKFEVEKEFFEE